METKFTALCNDDNYITCENRRTKVISSPSCHTEWFPGKIFGTSKKRIWLKEWLGLKWVIVMGKYLQSAVSFDVPTDAVSIVSCAQCGWI